MIVRLAEQTKEYIPQVVDFYRTDVAKLLSRYDSIRSVTHFVRERQAPYFEKVASGSTFPHLWNEDEAVRSIHMAVEGESVEGILESSCTRDHAGIVWLVVRKKGQGYGRALVQTLVAELEAQENPPHSLDLLVGKDNDDAIAFYKRCGFQEDREKHLKQAYSYRIPIARRL